MREEDPYEDKEDIFECLRKAAREWKSKDFQEDRAFLIDGWIDAQKNAITGFGYFLLPVKLLPVKGFLGMDFITLLRMHLKTEWKDSPGSFQKVTAASTLNGLTSTRVRFVGLEDLTDKHGRCMSIIRKRILYTCAVFAQGK